jgi:hypothetical protein
MYGRIIQTVGVIAVIVGIELEIYFRANIFMVLTTVGSLVFAVGTKIVYFKPWRRKGGR